MVIHELLEKVRGIIGSASETAYLDARIILKHVTGYDDVHLVVNKNEVVSQDKADKACEMARKRADHMPVAYIIGVKEFMSLDFKVGSGILIPRADTECIVEEALGLLKGGSVLDIGCGSGAVSVSIAKYCPEAKVTALDISETAVETTAFNAKNNGVSIKCVCDDIFKFTTESRFDMIISNPPYIESEEINTLMPDVKNYEPLSALDGGDDGLVFYRKITDFAFEHLNKGGYLIFEFGWKQHDDVVKIINLAGLEFVNTIYDLSGIKRGCTAKKI